MKKCILSFLGACLGVSVLAAKPAPALESLAPAQTQLVFKVNDMPAFLQEFRDSPWASLIDDEEVRQALLDMIDLSEELEDEELEEELSEEEREEIEEVLDLDTEEFWEKLEEISALMTGQCAFWLTVDLKAIDVEGFEPAVTFVAQLSDEEGADAEFLELMSMTRDEGEEAIAFNSDVEIYVSEQAMYYAFAQGLVLVSSTLPSLEMTLENLLDGGKSFADSSVYQSASEETLQADALMLGDLFSFFSALEDFMRGSAEFSENPHLDVELILNSLQLTEMEGFTMAFDFDGDAVQLSSDFLTSGRTGILRLLDAYEGTAVPDLSYVPSDVDTLSWAHFNIGVMLEKLLQIGQESFPQYYPMYEMQKAQITQQVGQDIVEVLMRNFEYGIVSMERLREEGGVEMLLRFAVANPVEVEGALLGAANVFAPGMELFVEEEYLGMTIKNLSPALTGGEEGMAYVLGEDAVWVSIAAPGLLREVLANESKAKDSFWERVVLDDVGIAVKKEVISRSWVNDLGAYVSGSMTDALSQMAMADEGLGQMMELVEVLAEALSYSAFSEAWMDEEGFHSRGTIMPARK